MIRKPKKEDGKAIFELVRSCAPFLDLNSLYLYYLIGAHFYDTSVVVEQDGSIVGFISGYIIPDRSDCLFIWQVAVDDSQRGKGTAKTMIDHILSRPECKDVKYLEATVTPSNEPSIRLFYGFAKRRGAEVREKVFIDSEGFGETSHEEEVLLTIGPFQK